jgi:cold-inducible RNA-binding protein
MRIYVENLSTKINDTELRHLAAPFGKPDSANIARELVGGASKGFAFVEYRMAEEGRAAIAGLNGKVIQGQALKVMEAAELKTRLWSATARR